MPEISLIVLPSILLDNTPINIHSNSNLYEDFDIHICNNEHVKCPNLYSLLHHLFDSTVYLYLKDIYRLHCWIFFNICTIYHLVLPNRWCNNEYIFGVLMFADMYDVAMITYLDCSFFQTCIMLYHC